jgi:hypothetical protein
VSLYYTRYSPAGEGNVALVDVSGDGGFAAICADNRALAGFITENIVRWEVSPFPRDLPVIDSKILRGGDVRQSPSWEIDSDLGRVDVTWSAIEPPLILNTPGPALKGRAVTHSLLFFAEEATMALDGEAVEGVPYVRDSWRGTIGRPGSSCCFALAETMTTVAGMNS